MVEKVRKISRVELGRKVKSLGVADFEVRIVWVGERWQMAIR